MSSADSAGVGETAVDAPLTNPPTESEVRLAPHSNWRWFWLALAIVSAPLLVPYFVKLWSKPTYQYFPFAIGVVAWLAYQRSDGRFYPPRGMISWAAIGLGLFFIAFGAVFKFPWFGAVAAVFFATAMLRAMRGPYDRTLLVTALPLFTVIQLVRLDTLLVIRLQRITTWFSSVLLDGLAIPHAVANNVIQLADRELFVAEACSGIQSVFTLGFLALSVVAWKRRRVWTAPIYLAIACLLAVFSNVVRVTVVALAASLYEIDLAEGWSHELLGYVALGLAFAFLLSFDFLMTTIFHEVPSESEFNPLVSGWNQIAIRRGEDDGERTTQRETIDQLETDRQGVLFATAQRWIQNRNAQIGFLTVIVLIAGLAVFQVVTSRRPENRVEGDSDLVFDPPSNLMGEMQTLSVVNHVSNRNYEVPYLGANSDVWECSSGDITAQIVLSQPHNGWHELCTCYERLDWLLLDRDIKSPEDLEIFEVETRNPDAMNSTYVFARFKQGPTARGYLLFSGIGSDGTLIDAPNSLAAFSHRVWNRIDSTGVWDQDEVLMLQMWVIVPDKLDPKHLNSLEKDFVAIRAKFADEIARNAGRNLPPVNTGARTTSIKLDDRSEVVAGNTNQPAEVH
ncbi:exosortase U [Roseiconus lacunae]|uniref:exosortase U n=1 Tax=Roseiconus lacunae TaxID=2605694 RepID=UPI0011F240B7|nr:exosortase U [Roseiconus lacunae]MCD0461695.1 exosortase U [Roseiconus lacunae]